MDPSRNAATQDWALPQLSQVLPLDEPDLRQIISYTNSLPDSAVAKHLNDLLGDSPQALQFITAYRHHRATVENPASQMTSDSKNSNSTPSYDTNGHQQDQTSMNHQPPSYAPPPGPPPSTRTQSAQTSQPPSYAPPPGAPSVVSRASARNHTNQVIEAAKIRAIDEQDMQQALQTLQYSYQIYNADIEPEHETEYPCSCPIHMYQARKRSRYGVQERWSNAVMYPGEKSYNDNPYASNVFSGNPYRLRVISPYGYNQFAAWGLPTPRPSAHAQSIHQTISLNNALNREAQAKIDAQEPKHIWEDDPLTAALSAMTLGDKKPPVDEPNGTPSERGFVSDGKRRQSLAAPVSAPSEASRTSKFGGFKKSLGIKSSEERAVAKVGKAVEKGKSVRAQILAEEQGRWPDEAWRQLVASYQDKVGMTSKIADLRARSPIQYLHLLRAGYFEPIPVAWANQASNPLKFSIEAAAGWRGITPAWRGYEDTAEERLYWVLNHREGSVGARMKPDYISEMNMARARMATAVEPPPLYFSADDTCHLQHTSQGYSRQVMPPPFQPFDRPESPTDDTMILLDVSGSMDFDPVRPVYDQYLIRRYERSTQPKNKDVAKAIVRRFTDAMANHDHQFRGYDLTTFSSQATYIGTINHQNLEQMWTRVRLGGGTRVMTGWQKCKEMHFQKHSESATHHPVYGWQAGPETPILRLLLLLDGEATDMDEFELDLLGLSWAHVTIFLIGVEGCPHHHRHANELQRISLANHHVSFVDAQGNCPERFVTHELLKRHLGYEVTMQEFESMEELPAYHE